MQHSKNWNEYFIQHKEETIRWLSMKHKTSLSKFWLSRSLGYKRRIFKLLDIHM